MPAGTFFAPPFVPWGFLRIQPRMRWRPGARWVAQSRPHRHGNPGRRSLPGSRFYLQPPPQAMDAFANIEKTESSLITRFEQILGSGIEAFSRIVDFDNGFCTYADNPYSNPTFASVLERIHDEFPSRLKKKSTPGVVQDVKLIIRLHRNDLPKKTLLFVCKAL